jgi:hypothetical protein
LESSVETNDNYGLSATRGDAVNTLSVSGAFGAARLTETAATRIDAGLSALKLSGGSAQDHRFEGRLNLGQTLSAPQDSFTFGVNAAQDETFNVARNSSDIALGRGRRRSAGGTAAWSHAFSERLSASVQTGMSRTGYGQLADASSYQNASLSNGLQYRLSETDSVNVNVGGSRYRTLDEHNRSSTTDFNLGWSHAISERSNASLSIGGYRTSTTALQPALACPLQFSLCAAGLVPFIVVQRPGQSSRRGLQFSTSARQRFDELTDIGFSASRQQAPSGAGLVVRSDSASITLSRALTPELGVSLTYLEARTVFEGVSDAPRPRSQTFNALLTQALSSQLSTRAGYQWSRSSEARSGSSAKANIFNATLKYEWPRLEMGR